MAKEDCDLLLNISMQRTFGLILKKSQKFQNYILYKYVYFWEFILKYYPQMIYLLIASMQMKITPHILPYKNDITFFLWCVLTLWENSCYCCMDSYHSHWDLHKGVFTCGLPLLVYNVFFRYGDQFGFLHFK